MSDHEKVIGELETLSMCGRYDALVVCVAREAIAMMREQDQFTEWFEKWSLTPETADQMVLNFSKFLCYMTGGMLSAIGYDLQTMKTAADDYQSRSYSEYYSECAQSAGWTSVKDRVPEIGTLCLVYDGVQMIVARHVRHGMWITPGMSRAVTHWMPLPETPKEETK